MNKTPEQKERKTILVVDDDAAIRESLTDLLDDEGYEVECAKDGQEALIHLQTSELPAMILLDLMMPNMDGVQFRTEQLKDERISKIPTVVMSANPHGLQKFSMVSVENFLRKPLDIEELLEFANRYCKK